RARGERLLGDQFDAAAGHVADADGPVHVAAGLRLAQGPDVAHVPHPRPAVLRRRLVEEGGPLALGAVHLAHGVLEGAKGPGRPPGHAGPPEAEEALAARTAAVRGKEEDGAGEIGPLELRAPHLMAEALRTE